MKKHKEMVGKWKQKKRGLKWVWKQRKVKPVKPYGKDGDVKESE